MIGELVAGTGEPVARASCSVRAMPALDTLPADAPLDDIVAVLERDGAVILDDVLRRPRSTGSAELQPYVEATGPAGTRSPGTPTRAPAPSSPARRRTATSSWTRSCGRVRAVLLPNCQRYQLHLTQVIRIMPGQAAQPIHRDRWAWGTRLRGLEPQLNTIWALTDFTAENGATQVVPGRPPGRTTARPSRAEIGYAEMTPARCCSTPARCSTAAAPTAPMSDRIGLNITYTLGWLRQEENQYLSCPPEIARTLDPELQAMIGYAMAVRARLLHAAAAAGRGPEIVGPEYGVTRRRAGSVLGTEASRAAVSEHLAAAAND